MGNLLNRVMRAEEVFFKFTNCRPDSENKIANAEMFLAENKRLDFPAFKIQLAPFICQKIAFLIVMAYGNNNNPWPKVGLEEDLNEIEELVEEYNNFKL